jgi:membrane-associated phospholipid phosphatase
VSVVFAPTSPREPAATRRSSASALLPGALLILLGILSFAGLLDGVREHGDLSSLDRPTLRWFVAHRDAVATKTLTLITDASSELVLPILVAILAAFWLWRGRDWWRPGLLVSAMALATVASTVVKHVVARPRPPAGSMFPPVETTFSFPSGHTLGAATFVLVAGYLLWSTRRTLSASLIWLGGGACAIAAVAVSRLYLGYHWLTDVVASTALAGVVLGIVIMVDRWARNRVSVR